MVITTVSPLCHRAWHWSKTLPRVFRAIALMQYDNALHDEWMYAKKFGSEPAWTRQVLYWKPPPFERSISSTIGSKRLIS
jgi:hypothetical protein